MDEHIHQGTDQRPATDPAESLTTGTVPAAVDERRAPDRPTQLDRSSWRAVLKRTVAEFKTDNLKDWAAALTYYAVLSIFPGLLVLVSVLGLIGDSAVQPLIDNLRALAPGEVSDLLTTGVQNLMNSRRAAGALAVVGLAVALWSASGYIAAFMRASNAIYDVPEGRPIWKTLPIRLGVTVLIGLLLIASALIVVFTGGLAERLATAVGAGSAVLAAWNILKWPVLLILVAVMIAVLYWASPNAKQAGVRWVSPGCILAVLLWVITSAGFAVYVGNFGSYNKTYGTLGGVIIFLIWLWISNLAILLGAEFDAELHRSRAIAAGQPPEQEPYVELRDTEKLDKQEDADKRRDPDLR
jgi:membrane protein